MTALNSAGASSGSDKVFASIKPTAPTSPTGLTSNPGVDQVGLSWTAPSSDGGAPIQSYQIHEGMAPGDPALGPGDPGTVIGTAPAGTTTYTVTGLAPGTKYYFYVTALNAAGSSPHSEEVAVTTYALDA